MSSIAQVAGRGTTRADRLPEGSRGTWHRKPMPGSVAQGFLPALPVLPVLSAAKEAPSKGLPSKGLP